MPHLRITYRYVVAGNAVGEVSSTRDLADGNQVLKELERARRKGRLVCVSDAAIAVMFPASGLLDVSIRPATPDEVAQ